MKRRLLAYSTLAGTSLALLWHFSNIWRYGEYLIAEPNRAVLVGETALLVVIAGFGFYLFGVECRLLRRETLARRAEKYSEKS